MVHKWNYIYENSIIITMVVAEYCTKYNTWENIVYHKDIFRWKVRGIIWRRISFALQEKREFISLISGYYSPISLMPLSVHWPRLQTSITDKVRNPQTHTPSHTHTHTHPHTSQQLSRGQLDSILTLPSLSYSSVYEYIHFYIYIHRSMCIYTNDLCYIWYDRWPNHACSEWLISGHAYYDPKWEAPNG